MSGGRPHDPLAAHTSKKPLTVPSADREVTTDERSGFPVIRAGRLVTDEHVAEALDDD